MYATLIGKDRNVKITRVNVTRYATRVAMGLSITNVPNA